MKYNVVYTNKKLFVEVCNINSTFEYNHHLIIKLFKHDLLWIHYFKLLNIHLFKIHILFNEDICF